MAWESRSRVARFQIAELGQGAQQVGCKVRVRPGQGAVSCDQDIVLVGLRLVRENLVGQRAQASLRPVARYGAADAPRCRYADTRNFAGRVAWTRRGLQHQPPFAATFPGPGDTDEIGASLEPRRRHERPVRPTGACAPSPGAWRGHAGHRRWPSASESRAAACAPARWVDRSVSPVCLRRTGGSGPRAVYELAPPKSIAPPPRTRPDRAYVNGILLVPGALRW